MENDIKTLAENEIAYSQKTIKKFPMLKFSRGPLLWMYVSNGTPKKGCIDFPLLSEVFHNPLVSLAGLRLASVLLQGTWLVLWQQKK